MTDPSLHKHIFKQWVILHTSPTDLGADIAVAGQQILHHLNEHVNNLLPLGIVPHTADGDKMQLLVKMLIKFSFEG